MNIKRIIREEAEEFDWIRDITPFVIFTLDNVNNYVVRLSDDVETNLKQQAYYIKLLGIGWVGNAKRYAKVLHHIEGVDVIRLGSDGLVPSALYYYLDNDNYHMGYFDDEDEMTMYLMNAPKPIFIS